MKKGIFALLTVCLSLTASAQNQWGDWLQQQVYQHARIKSMQHQVKAADYRLNAYRQPLFNPALETEVEREGDAVNYRIGFATDIDWHDVQSQRASLGQHEYQLAAVMMADTINGLLSETISSQVNFLLSSRQYELVQQQVEQDIALVELVKDEVAAGAATKTDLALFNAVVTESMVAEQEALADYLVVEQQTRLLVNNISQAPQVDARFWQADINLMSVAQVQQLPKAQAQYYEWLKAQQVVSILSAESRPVPSLAMNVGEQDGTATIAMSVSVPLTFRNDYSNDISEARELALSAEQDYRNLINDLHQTIRMQVIQLKQLKQRYQQWQSLNQDTFSSQLDILQKRLQSGDLTVADYQGLLQQLRAGQVAGLSLERAFKQTYIDYLTTTGQLPAVIAQLQH